MCFFKEFKEDLSEAVDQLIPGGSYSEEADDEVDLAVEQSIDVDTELSKLDGLLEQARMDEEKAAAAGNNIAFLGKIMTVSDFDPMKAIDPEKIHYVTADEWQAMQD